ncbi:Qdr3 protein [Saccharomycopsis crataegensis]|uniref:Qdr3 protein n=1 Tax=Saccharomycopsis crataegensis TaxID=43959 RepID=A0AAV5QRN7_9ASCO|nr:Qdr3 protein [Saccharomycopsis crataegensis]
MSKDQSGADSISSSVRDVGQNQPKPLEPRLSQEDEEQAKNANTLKRERLAKTLSSTSISQIVPKDERRGLLSSMCLIPEYQDARNYPDRMKKSLVLIIATAAVIGPMGTSIIFPVIDDLTDVLHTNTKIVNVSVGIYLLSMGIFPIWWSSISERIGRRTVYIISFSFLFCFCIGAALTPNIEAFIVFRMLMGASSSSVQSIGSGGINDLYRSQELGKAMSLFYLGTLVAPFISPIIGGAIGSKWGFRGTCWFMVIFAGCLWFLIVLCLPETLRRQESAEAIAKYLSQLNEDTKRFNQEQQGQVDDERKIQNSTPISDINHNNNIDNINKDGDNNNNEKDPDETSSEDTPQFFDADDVRSIATNLSRNNIDEIREAISRVSSHPAVAAEGLPLSRINTVDRVQAAQLERTNLEKVVTELSKLKSNSSVQPSGWPHYRHILYIYLIKPTKSVVFLRYPPVLLMLIYSAISFMCLYFVNISITYQYSRAPYNFSTIIVGLCYIPNSTSYILTSLFSGRWIDKLLQNFEKKHGFLSPEARISWNCYIAAIILPLSLLISGWCWDKKTFWIIPMVGTFIWGAGSLLVINTTVTYVVDSLPGRGATGVALNNLLRQLLATLACFVQEPLTVALGPGVLYSILAGILFVSGSTLLIVKRYSSQWRENYDLQKLYDIVDS